MALAHFQRTFTDASGNVKPGLSVTVRRESDNGLAALFSDAGSVTPKSNPFNTDANGYGDFYAVNERYRIQATDIDWRDEDLISQPDLAASLAAISTNTSDISTNTSDILERAELSGGPLANFTAMPQVGGDPIVESGSNADGEWTRWADGTLIMVQQITSPVTYGNGIDDGGAHFSEEVNFNFPSANVGTMKGSGSHPQATNGFLLNCNAEDEGRWSTYIYRAQNFSVGHFDAPIELVAIGRWK